MHDSFLLYLTDHHICMITVFLRTIYRSYVLCLLNHAVDVFFAYLSDDHICMLTRPWWCKYIHINTSSVYYDYFLQCSRALFCFVHLCFTRVHNLVNFICTHYLFGLDCMFFPSLLLTFSICYLFNSTWVG